MKGTYIIAIRNGGFSSVSIPIKDWEQVKSIVDKMLNS